MSTHYFTRDHEWIRVDGNTAIIGITDFAQKQLGDVVFVELPDVGRELSAGDAFAMVESVKAASDVFAPVSGKVTAINEELSSDPELVNQDPMAEGRVMHMVGGRLVAMEGGWLIKLTLSKPDELKGLMSQAAYDKYIKDQN